MTIHDRGDPAAGRGPISAHPVEPQGVDRLVELHVLAEPGDLAAAAAHWWLADAEARQVWETVVRTRAALRSGRTIGPD